MNILSKFFNMFELDPGPDYRLSDPIDFKTSIFDTLLTPPELRPYWQTSEEERHDFEDEDKEEKLIPFDENADGKTIDGNGLIKEVKP